MASTPHIAKFDVPRSWRVPLLALLGVVLALVAAPRAQAATAPAVTTTTATPAAFVPDWDGETDSTVIQYQLAERSTVLVRILDARGRIVATIDAGRREAGMQLVAWDGRGSDGRIQPPGAYRVRVDATPVPAAANEPGVSQLGGTVIVAGARAAQIVVQAPPVAVRGVRLGRATLGRSGAISRTTVQFDLSTAASISAAIVDSSGHAVRTLAARRMRAGANRLPWDGRSTSGATLPDGEYALVVAASGSGRPTATTRVPLRIDRTVPRLATARRVTARSGTSGMTVPVTVTVDEQATVVLRAGRRTVRRSIAPGTHRLSIAASELGIPTARRTRSVIIRVTATDEAGNAVVHLVVARIPAATRPAPTPTPPTQPTQPTQPTPSTPNPSGRLPWPVAGGIVTSEFGMRSGRMHQGLDIAAPSGTPIHSVANGTVTYVGAMSGYGNIVIVDNGGGLRTYYAHMSRFGAFAVGQAVTPIDTIGYVGCTGHCTGPHVHFETRIADVPRDPRSFLTPG
jgi:murein DD-endopeptidase MepM/ murein hydrolase activator NlpD